MLGKLLVIGFGPGSFEHMTKRAQDAIQESDCIIGYKTYVELIQDLLTDQEIISTGMSEEVSRAQAAVRLAEEGKTVAVISSGDAGVYGMAGLVYEVLIEKGWKEATGVSVEVIPGISAINSCASLLGAPIMHDACTISLSDHLTPWDLIEKRIDAAAQADFVVTLYNPKSGRRTRQIQEAQRILLNYRSPSTPVGLVKSAYRDRQHIVITDLEHMLDHDIGMLTTVVIGNSATFLYDNKMITPRGYQRKYTLSATEQRLKPHERLRHENEPWALHKGINDMVLTPKNKTKKNKESSLQIALEALSKLDHVTNKSTNTNQLHVQLPVNNTVTSIFELAVSPGIANKKFTPQQMMTLAEVVGSEGSMEYTPHHQIILRIPTSEPDVITEKLGDVGFLVEPIGDVFQLKACDFCEGEKKDSIPHAEELHQKLGGLDLPKELKIGFNGCGMACFGAVNEDIGIIFRKGKFDLFLGAKTVGRTAHAGQPVAEGIEPDKIVEVIENIVYEYKEKGHPNERFFKYFKRVGNIQGYTYKDMTPKIEIEPAPCGD
ncbi:precorrin-3B C(17)-methyltransferase [Metabacillus sediminilitoris]|uniref:Precorrin-3B C(17)-methyltransferase n=1 Tax=Metabacillus sediminilitoris TaxID=2567941 RepID=A0A4V6RXK2_9BACI|nr:precorrin-3B C(17)-methyltransferase [Metabacillus sediminilitoris]QGQ45037.1 precorrin-3B C(17)-methyltransferase [Metabacillus sediminilitoris]THF78669.1 precorrin-3B C(17)-methyltransferase [Metabacillus sediminilitoris]